MSNLEKIRAMLDKKKADSGKKGLENSIEFSTSQIEAGKEGKIKIRILPPISEEDAFFYRTHSYNWLTGVEADGSDKILFSKKQLRDKSGKLVKNPIDKLVADIYLSKDEQMIKEIATKSKRKRRFYFNCLILTPEGPQFKIFVDSTNKGEVVKKICEAMAIPFCRDTEDGWFEEIAFSDEPVDLLDIDEGYDISITKMKTGKEKWDIDFKVEVSKKERGLSKEEKKLLSERVDLEKYIEYIEDLETVEKYLRKLTGDEEVTSVSETVSKTKPASKKRNEEALNSDELSQLEEDENSSEDSTDMTEEEVMSLLDD